MTTEKVSTTVPLNWQEVSFTNCPMVSANNVDQELGWCREKFKKIGVEYAYFRHAPENNWYRHYIHNFIRFGGLYHPIAFFLTPRPLIKYVSRVLLRPSWSDRLEGMSISVTESANVTPVTTLVGAVARSGCPLGCAEYAL